MIGAHGMWNAATAVSHGMDVATANPTEFNGFRDRRGALTCDTAREIQIGYEPLK